MCNRNRVVALFAGAVILASLAMPAMSVAGTVVYFYNQTNSAAPVSVSIKGKTTITVKAVASGHISAAIVLPKGYISASAALQKSLKDLGFPLPTLINISFRSPGGSSKPGLPLHSELFEKAHTRALIYFMRVKVPGAAPEPVDWAAVGIEDADYKLAAEGKALAAIVDETQSERFRLEGGSSMNVWFRRPNGNVWNEVGNRHFTFVSPEELKPGNYDILAASMSLTFQAGKTAKPIGSLTAADLPPGKISIYLIRTPGKLEHVIDLSP